jgi:hypothetical protein
MRKFGGLVAAVMFGAASRLVAAAGVTSRLSLPQLSLRLREAQKIASTLIHVKLTEEIPWN